MTYRESVASAKRAYLYSTLAESGGNMARAAKVAGVHRTTFYKLLQKHGISAEHRKDLRQPAPSQ